MVHETLGPDEQIYVAQAQALRAGGVAAIRDLADEFVDEPTLKSFPSPLRWLWTALVALALPVSPVAIQVASGALIGPVVWLLTHSAASAVLAAVSPLALTLSQRKLQDVPVALATLVAIACATQHSVAGVTVALFVALSMKESCVLAVPSIAAAWLMSGGSLSGVAAAIAFGTVAWACVLAILFGKRLPSMFRTSASGHATKYAAEHQSGAPHRLLVDLVLASPVSCLFAAIAIGRAPAEVATLGSAAIVLLAFHMVAPIRNVRFVIAADVLIRAIAIHGMRWPFIELPLALAADAYVAWRIRHVYDPVTQALATSLGMPSVSSNK